MTAQTPPSELQCQLALTRLKGITLDIAQLLLNEAGSLQSLLAVPLSSWAEACGIDPQFFATYNQEEALAWADKEMEFLQRGGITTHFFTDADYPQRLLECTDAPLLLFTKGSASLNTPHAVSIVGTRHATNYGKGFCETFIADLAKLFPDTLIISGLAYGIDIAAHRAALKEHLPTAAVLAHGLNTIYPAAHRSSAIEILRQGALVTEYSSQHATQKQHFVARNRIVAGMADATIVVESATKGGALITGDIAGSYGRDLFALPGRIGDPYSAGCNQLIAQNKAALITSAEEFARQMNWIVPKKRKTKRATPELFPLPLTELEERILALLVKEGECQINRLAVMANLPTAQLLPLLLELEFKGIIRTFPGGLYRPA